MLRNDVPAPASHQGHRGPQGQQQLSPAIQDPAALNKSGNIGWHRISGRPDIWYIAGKISVVKLDNRSLVFSRPDI